MISTLSIFIIKLVYDECEQDEDYIFEGASMRVQLYVHVCCEYVLVKIWYCTIVL